MDSLTVNLFIDTSKQLGPDSKTFRKYDELLTPVDGISSISIGTFDLIHDLFCLSF